MEKEIVFEESLNESNYPTNGVDMTQSIPYSHIRACRHKVQMDFEKWKNESGYRRYILSVINEKIWLGYRVAVMYDGVD